MKKNQPKTKGNNKKSGKKPVTRKVTVPVAKGKTRKQGSPGIEHSLKGGKLNVIVRHSEYVGEVFANSSGVFQTYQWLINPSNLDLFPWLCTIAPGWESYRFRKLHFRYETEAPTSDAGTIGLAVDYDALDPAPLSKTQVMSYEGAVRSPIWNCCEFQCSQQSLNKRKSYFVNEPQITGTSDVRLNDVGILYVFTQGLFGVTTSVGELYVDYEIEFMTPSLVNTTIQTATSVRGYTVNGTALQGNWPANSMVGGGITYVSTGGTGVESHSGNLPVLRTGFTPAGGASSVYAAFLQDGLYRVVAALNQEVAGTFNNAIDLVAQNYGHATATPNNSGFIFPSGTGAPSTSDVWTLIQDWLIQSADDFIENLVDNVSFPPTNSAGFYMTNAIDSYASAFTGTLLTLQIMQILSGPTLNRLKRRTGMSSSDICNLSTSELLLLANAPPGTVYYRNPALTWRSLASRQGVASKAGVPVWSLSGREAHQLGVFQRPLRGCAENMTGKEPDVAPPKEGEELARHTDPPGSLPTIISRTQEEPVQWFQTKSEPTREERTKEIEDSSGKSLCLGEPLESVAHRYLAIKPEGPFICSSCGILVRRRFSSSSEGDLGDRK